MDGGSEDIPTGIRAWEELLAEWEDRRRKPPRDFFFGDGGRPFPSSWDGAPPIWSYEIQLKGLSGGPGTPPSGLLSPAAKLLARVGGDINFDRDVLRQPYGSELTDLGAALICYAALTTFLFDDPYLYRSGRLRDFGQELAKHYDLKPISAALKNVPGRGDVQVLVRFSEIEEGSLTFKQAVIAVGTAMVGTASLADSVVSIAADAPQAYGHYEELYAPAIRQTVDTAVDYVGDSVEFTGQYMSHLFSELEEIFDIAVVPAGPEPTSPERSDQLISSRPSKRKQRQQITRG